MNKYLLEDARRLGFNLTRNEWGHINHDFQLLGYKFLAGFYDDRHKEKDLEKLKNVKDKR